MVEYSIGKIKKRYKLFGGKIPYNYLLMAGVMLRYCISTHIQFQIGLIKPNKKRRCVLTYIKKAFDTWVDHPIDRDHFNTILQLCKSNNNDQDVFKLVSNKNEIERYWNKKDIDMFLFDLSDRFIKGGGIGNIKKSLFSLSHSKTTIECYIGTGAYEKILVVKHIRMKMRVIHEQRSKSSGNSSSCVFMITENGIVNDENGEFYFPDNICSVIGRCSNIYGLRTCNMCSHQVTSLLYFWKIYHGEAITDPTQNISTSVKTIHNISKWVGSKNKMSLRQQINYVDDVYHNEFEAISDSDTNLYDIDSDESDIEIAPDNMI